MIRILVAAAILVSLNCNAQLKNRSIDVRYFHHWESTNPKQYDMEIIIHKDNRKVRITEFKLSKEGTLGQGVVFSTVYICVNKKGRVEIETIDPSTLQIIQSEYILTHKENLLRVTGKDTIVFRKRY